MTEDSSGEPLVGVIARREVPAGGVSIGECLDRVDGELPRRPSREVLPTGELDTP